MSTALAARLTQSRATCTQIRSDRKALQRAQTEVSIYKNDLTGKPGLIFVGRIHIMEPNKYQFPKKGNVSASGYFELRATHYIAKFIASVPNNPNECKNIIIRVDKFGGKWRWTGFMHHWKVETRGGVDYLSAFFNDDMQYPQFILAPPNPALPIPVFQFPRDGFIYAPGIWSISTVFLLNLIRNQAPIYHLPDDPWHIEGWTQPLDCRNWQVHIKCKPFITDSSLWNIVAYRMNTLDSVIAAALDDGQLCLDYRRYFTAEGEMGTDMFGQPVANGALVFEVFDRSGFALPGGTFVNGNAAGGLARSVIQWGAGFVEDSFEQVSDDETLYPDEYWQSGFLGNFATAPALAIRDSWWNDLQSVVNHSPATAVSGVVGGDNPTADAIVKLLIEATGNLIGFFFLGGFDSLGDIASDVIMPFLVGTILAWDEWKNTSRATNLGWAHLFEVYNSGAEQNAWSLAAVAAMRGLFKATDAETSHTMVIDESTWVLPGVHCQMKDRVASSAGALQRLGIDMMFVNQIEEQILSGDDSGKSEFLMKCGQNKASLSTGERFSQMLKNALDRIADIGFHLVS